MAYHAPDKNPVFQVCQLKKNAPIMGAFLKFAERKGFEPSI